MTTQTEVDQTDNSIAIGEGISTAFSLLFSNLATAFKLAIMPVISILIIAVVLFFFVVQLILDIQANPSPDLPVMYSIVTIGIAVLVTLIPIQYFTAWIRFLNTGNASISETFVFNLKKRHFVIFGKSFLLYIVMNIAIAIAVGLITFAFSASEMLSAIALIIAIFLIFVVALRLSYVFPAAALDQPYSFFKSWTDTKGQWLSLLVSFIILSILFVIMQIALIFVIGVFFTIFGGASSLLIGGASDLSQSLAGLMSISTLLLVIPAYFIILIISMISYIPFINLHYYCFKKNAGWIDDNKLVDRFS
ncbi:hypothetical protein [Kiloniella sp.]|uniref:hypothetical protein n=1 Tax=Kiloniella sp. TaxID=1938587 RepID=UPI003A914250